MRTIISFFLLTSQFLAAQSSACLNFSTYFGKLNFDEINGVCVDKLNNSYVIGNTYNTDLPVTSGAFQTNSKGNYEAFLAKFDSCGYLIWCTYFGSSGFDSGEKIAFSNDNTIVFCGHTDGTDIATTAGCFQPSNAGTDDCFLAKFSLNGNPIWITYFGSTLGDFAYDIKTDTLNNIVIGGTTISTSLYTTSSSFQQNFAGGSDAFIARFNKQGNLKFCTYYGGASSEDIHALAIDRKCNIIGIGGSFSSNLSTSVGCYQPLSNGGMEVYVLKLDSTGQRIFSTYIGDTGADDAFGVCTDPQNSIYLSGHTNSTNFYTSPGAFQFMNAGNNDAWCLKLNALGQMQWSTLLGGVANDFVARMCINNLNELTVLIKTSSANFPMLGVNNYTVLNGNPNSVLVKLMSNGVPFWSTYFGGSAGETPKDIVSIRNNKVIFVGSTTSSDFPLTGYSYQNSFAGTEDGSIACYNTSVNLISSIEQNGKSNCDPKFITSPDKIEIQFGKCNHQGRYDIYNMSGIVVLSGKIMNDFIDISGIASGFYIARFDFGNGYEKIPIIKE